MAAGGISDLLAIRDTGALQLFIYEPAGHNAVPTILDAWRFAEPSDLEFSSARFHAHLERRTYVRVF